MRERPILFSGPMVRAILAGEKTMTRRIVRLPHGTDSVRDGVNVWVAYGSAQQGVQQYLRCPYGQPGDLLWVRESWHGPASFDDKSPAAIAEACVDAGYSKPWAPIWFAADGAFNRSVNYAGPDSEWKGKGRQRPSIHMPRWASRITLRVTSVAVQRLQDITPADVLAEGIGHDVVLRMAKYGEPVGVIKGALLDAWETGWDGINGHRAAWASNPWVWVVGFKREAHHA